MTTPTPKPLLAECRGPRDPEFTFRFSGRQRRAAPVLRPTYLGRGGNVVAASGNWTGSLAGLTTQAGDLLIANIAYRDSAPFTVPSGWTLVAQESQGNTSATNTTAVASGVMAYTVRGASVPSLVFTRTGGAVAQGRIQAYRNMHATAPLIAGVSATMASNGTIVQTGAGLTTDCSNALVVIGACNAVNGSSVAADMKALGDPQTGWTERCDDSSAVSPTTNQAYGDAIKATAGATGILQWRNSATTRAVIIAAAFRPIGALYVPPALLMEDSGYVLLEDGGKILLEV